MKTIKALLLAGMIGLTGLLAGCGDGGAGGTGGTGGTTPPAPTPTPTPNLSLIISGQPVTVSTPATVQITGPANTLITLATTVGILSKSQVATDSNGSASVQLSVSLNDNDDGVVTGSYSLGTIITAVTKSVSFTVGAANLSLGKPGTPFSSGELAIGIGSALLSPGGTTQITAVVWDNLTNAAYAPPINVSFSSVCILSGTATVSTPVQAVNGVASTTYKNISCQGSDLVTASIAVGGGTKSATGTIRFTSLTANNISFVSASPNYINLAGVGAPVTLLTFKVLDATGIAIPNQVVDFALNTTVGGLSLTSASNQTDANGLVSTSINPGSIPTSVRVTATVRGSLPAISTQSSQLAVTTGLPAQGHMSIAVSTHAVEAFEYDGVSVDVTARLADRYGNPVPDGTTVNFVAEGGTISDPTNAPAGFCQTRDGSCLMKWRSQAPRPGDHRVSLLAYSIGEKDYDDADGNGYFSTGVSTVDTIIQEQGEAFQDADESAAWNAGEFYHDFNLSRTYNAADGLYYGARCLTNCGGGSMDVSASNVIVLSSSSPIMSSSTTSITNAGTAIFQMWDIYGQPMPAGTKLICSTSGDFSPSGPFSYTVPDMVGVRTGATLTPITPASANQSNAYTLACGVKPSVIPPTIPGKLFVTVTTPGNLTTVFALVDLIP